jgi:hypothetical protein
VLAMTLFYFFDLFSHFIGMGLRLDFDFDFDQISSLLNLYGFLSAWWCSTA